MFLLSVRVLIAVFCIIGLTCTVDAATEKQNIYIVAEDLPPFSTGHRVEGAYARDQNLVRQIFKEIGFNTKIAFLPWKRALREIKEGRAAGILSCSQTQERAKYMYFRTPTSHFTNGFFYLADRNLPHPQTLEDVKTYDVASIEGHANLAQLRNAGLEPLTANDTKSALLMLEAGRFDYLYLNREITMAYLQKNGLAERILFSPVSSEDVFFCFNKKYPQIEQIMDSFEKKLHELRANGTLHTLQAKYK
ncbi:substrate-binding periplasmic protein [Terasakiella sp.]|uniref:substrate-binding periplasmic protein n=1 Tax=Terasakiella sp. TaxID=2034861 RepID=UPI003AA9E1E9